MDSQEKFELEEAIKSLSGRYKVKCFLAYMDNENLYSFGDLPGYFLCLDGSKVRPTGSISLSSIAPMLLDLAMRNVKRG